MPLPNGDANSAGLVAAIDPTREMYCLDLSPRPTALREALEKRVDRLVVLAGEEKPTKSAPHLPPDGLEQFPDQHFDLIFACFVTAPRCAPGTLVAACKRVLKSGGRLLLEVPVDPAARASDSRAAGAWRAALTQERFWVDLEQRRTPTRTETEYIMRLEKQSRADPGRAPSADRGTEVGAGKFRAFSPDHCYLTVSGLK